MLCKPVVNWLSFNYWAVAPVYSSVCVSVRMCVCVLELEMWRIRIWQCSNFERFQQIRNSTNILSALLSNVNSWKNSCSTTDFMCTESQAVQTNLFFFLIFNLSHKLPVQCVWNLTMHWSVIDVTLLCVIVSLGVIWRWPLTLRALLVFRHHVTLLCERYWVATQQMLRGWVHLSQTGGVGSIMDRISKFLRPWVQRAKSWTLFFNWSF